MKSKKGRIIIITLCALFIALSVGIFMMTGEIPAHTAPTADDPDNSLQSADDPANTAEGDVTSPDVPAPAVTESTNQPGVPDRVVSTTSPTGDSQTAASSFDADTYTEPSAPDDGQAPDIAEPVSDNPENTSSEPGTVRLCLGGDTSIDSEFADAANKWGIDPKAKTPAVVHEDGLPVRHRLRDERVQGLGKILLAVVERDDHAHQGLCIHGHRPVLLFPNMAPKVPVKHFQSIPKQRFRT